MELRVNEVQIPEQITFNYEEVKEWVSDGIAKYKRYDNMIIDADGVKIAKADRAELNKLKKALNDERIRQEKEYMQPFNDFKGKINELIKMIDEPVKLIDGKIKEHEAEQKAIKEDKIKAIFEEAAAESEATITLEMIFENRWLNASESLKKIQEEIKAKIEKFNTDIKTLQMLPEFSFEAIEVYKSTLDINKAIAEGQRLADIQKRKEEAVAKARQAELEAKRQAEEIETKTTVPAKPAEEPVLVEEGKWIRFEACLTIEQAGKLKEFFNTNNISFRAV